MPSTQAASLRPSITRSKDREDALRRSPPLRCSILRISFFLYAATGEHECSAPMKGLTLHQKLYANLLLVLTFDTVAPGVNNARHNIAF